MQKAWPRGNVRFFIQLVQNFFKDEGWCLFDIATIMFGTASVCSYTGKGVLSLKEMLSRLLVDNLGEYFATNTGRKALLTLIDSVKYAKRLDDTNWLAYRRTKQGKARPSSLPYVPTGGGHHGRQAN
jgi:hypothetical protein